MKKMLMHSFVLDALDTTGADTVSLYDIDLYDNTILFSSMYHILTHTHHIQYIQTK